MWSVMNVVCYEHVCYEHVCNERGLFWKGIDQNIVTYTKILPRLDIRKVYTCVLRPVKKAC